MWNAAVRTMSRNKINYMLCKYKLYYWIGNPLSVWRGTAHFYVCFIIDGYHSCKEIEQSLLEIEWGMQMWQCVCSIVVADGAMCCIDVAEWAMCSIDVADWAMCSIDVADWAICSIGVADWAMCSIDVADWAINVQYRCCRLGNVQYRCCRLGNVQYRCCRLGNVQYRCCRLGNVQYRCCRFAIDLCISNIISTPTGMISFRCLPGLRFLYCPKSNLCVNHINLG